MVLITDRSSGFNSYRTLYYYFYRITYNNLMYSLNIYGWILGYQRCVTASKSIRERFTIADFAIWIFSVTRYLFRINLEREKNRGWCRKQLFRSVIPQVLIGNNLSRWHSTTWININKCHSIHLKITKPYSVIKEKNTISILLWYKWKKTLIKINFRLIMASHLLLIIFQ